MVLCGLLGVRFAARDVARVSSEPEIKERLFARGDHPAPTTSIEHDKILREQIQSFGETVKRLGLKAQ